MSGPNSSDPIYWIIRLGGNAGVLLQAATEAKTVPKFTDALNLNWSALPEKAIDIRVTYAQGRTEGEDERPHPPPASVSVAARLTFPDIQNVYVQNCRHN